MLLLRSHTKPTAKQHAQEYYKRQEKRYLVIVTESQTQKVVAGGERLLWVGRRDVCQHPRERASAVKGHPKSQPRLPGARLARKSNSTAGQRRSSTTSMAGRARRCHRRSGRQQGSAADTVNDEAAGGERLPQRLPQCPYREMSLSRQSALHHRLSRSSIPTVINHRTRRTIPLERAAFGPRVAASGRSVVSSLYARPPRICPR